MKLLRNRGLWAAAGMSLSSILLAWTAGPFSTSPQVSEKKSEDPVPAVTVCTSPNPPDDPGAFAASPGNWFNPERYGTGWSLNFVGPQSNQQLMLFWHTFNRAGRPVWLQSGNAFVGPDPLVAGGRRWTATLHYVRYVPGVGTDNGTPVGNVTLRFPPGSATSAEVTWSWNEYDGGAAHSECLYDLYRAQIEAKAAGDRVNPSYTANWFEPQTWGWGIDINVGQTRGGTRTEHSVFDIYDVNGEPVWFESLTATPEWNGTGWLTQPVVVHKSKKGANEVCRSTDDCRITTVLPIGEFNGYSRAFSSPSTAAVDLRALTQGVPNTPNVNWPPAAWTPATGNTAGCPGTGCRAVQRLTDTAVIMVSQTSCAVPANIPGVTSCPVNVSWATSIEGDPAPVVEQVNVAPASGVVPLTAGGYGARDVLFSAGQRAYFQLKHEGQLLATTPIVTGRAADAAALPPLPTLPTPPVEDLASTAVGFTPGAMRVDESGSTRYRVPISVPKGRADLAPNLAIAYSSGAGDGVAGWGATIEGPSVISRCRQTVESGDGATQPMGYEPSTHAYCLDGQRLFKVGGTSPDGADAGYRTQVDSFRKVVVDGLEATGIVVMLPSQVMQPQRFKVYNKDGTLSIYEARRYVDPNGLTNRHYAVEWWLSSVQDATRQNKVEYFYNEDVDAAQASRNGSMALTSVRWTGGRVTFEYDARAQINSGYVLAGSLVSQDRWLRKIDVWSAQNTVLRTYTPSYENLPQNDALKRLVAVQECAGTVCLEPTVFDWYDASTQRQATTGAAFPDARAFQYGDVDGDGRADLVLLDRSGGLGVALSRPTSAGIQFAPTVAAMPDIPKYCAHFSDEDGECFDPASDYYGRTWTLLDINTDGREDLLAYTTNSSGKQAWRFRLSNGTTFSTTEIPLPESAASSAGVWPKVFIADFDGNGTPDIMTYEDVLAGNSRVWLLRKPSDGSTTYSFAGPYPVISSSTGPLCTLGQMIEKRSDRSDAIDFNGDGRADFITRSRVNCSGSPDPSADYAYTFINGGLQGNNFVFSAPNHVVPASGAAIRISHEVGALQVADINGDGNPDLLWRDVEDVLHINLGLAFQGAAFGPTQCARRGCPAESDRDVRLLDYDGDGRLDLWLQDGGNNYIAYLWKGGTSFDAASVATGFHGGNNDWIKGFGDLDGDGLADNFIVRYGPTGASWQAVRNTAHHLPRNLLRQVSDGLGARNDITYQPLTFSSVYDREYGALTMDAGYGSPVQDSLSPQYVTTRIDTSAPTAANANSAVTTRYRYGGLKIQGGGRGSLGFREVHSLANGLLTTTEYEQKFPLAGVPKSTRVTQAEWAKSACDSNPDATTCMRYGNTTRADGGVLLNESVDTWHYSTPSGGIDRPLPRSAPEPIFIYRETSTTIKRDPQFGVMSAEQTLFTYDPASGNLLASDSRNYADELVTQIRQVTTTNKYEQDNAAAWILGKLTESRVTAVRPGQAAQSRLTRFTYDANGLLLYEYLQPDGPAAERSVKAHVYDAFGNEVRTALCDGTVTGADCAATNSASIVFRPATGAAPRRYSRVEFDASGLFPVSTFETFQRAGVGDGTAGADEFATGTVTARDAYGTATDTTLVNGGRVLTATDRFGRPYFSADLKGQVGLTTRAWCTTALHPAGATCPAAAVYRVEVQTAGGPTAWAYHDRLDREVLSVREGFGDNEYVAVKKSYDVRARPYETSEPYFTFAPSTPNVGQAAGVSVYYTRTEYDLLDRPKTITHPNSSLTTIANNGLTTITTSPPNAQGFAQRRTQARNALGETKLVTDHNGSTVATTYDSAGNAVAITRTTADAAPATTTATFDGLGRKIAASDPDAGSWTYVYGPLGDVLVKSGSGVCSTTRYDARGRAIERLDFAATACGIPDASPTAAMPVKIGWNYDASATGRGGLANVKREERSLHPYTRTHAYDSVGREQSNTVNVFGSNYVQRTTYDQYNRPFQSFLSVNGTHIVPEMGELYQYNRRGFRTVTRDAFPDTTGTIYSEVRQHDARGNAVEERRADNPSLTINRLFEADTGRLASIRTANGTVQDLAYTYDAIGNLASRSDQSGAFNRVETYEYDTLQRLTATRTSVNTQPAVETRYAYNAAGNLTTNRQYEMTKPAACNGVTGTVAPGPGAVTTFTSSGGVTRLCYDARGNVLAQIDASGENSKTLAYRTYDQVATVTTTNGINNVTGTFSYTPEGTRVMYAEAGVTTVYIGNTEVRIDGTSPLQIRRYTAGTVIRMTMTFPGRPAPAQRQYLLTDAQGTTHRVVDGDGNLLSTNGAQAFTPFGARAAPDTGTLLGAVARYTYDTTATALGYTGHQQYDRLGLIHMGGRIYDPLLGRFLQADPFVQDPTNVQNLNRYSYVNNNPLSYTDPSGYWGKQQQGYLRQVIAIAISVYAANAIEPGGTFMGISVTPANQSVLAVTAGFTSGAVASGNLRGAMYGAFSASWGIAAGNAAKALGPAAGAAFRGAGAGMIEAMNGGSFGHAFISAGLGSVLAPHLEMGGGFGEGVVRTLTAGTIAEITGGKFRDGAASEALQAAFETVVERTGTNGRMRRAAYGNKDEWSANAVLLNDPNGAEGWGHLAVLIGDDIKGWHYFSSDGDNVYVTETFKDYEAFTKSDLAARYTRAKIMFQTDEYDATQIGYAYAHFFDDYGWSSNNCADYALGILGSTWSFAEHASGRIGSASIPNWRYENLFGFRPFDPKKLTGSPAVIPRR